MPQRQPTSDFNWSDRAILTGLFVLLGFVLGRAIHLGYLTQLLQAAQSVVQKVQGHAVSARSLNFIAQTKQKGTNAGKPLQLAIVVVPLLHRGLD